jgi:hypothetical protein
MIEMIVIELVWSGRKLSGRQECADLVGENAHETGRRPFCPCRGETTLLLRLAHSGQPFSAGRRHTSKAARSRIVPHQISP